MEKSGVAFRILSVLIAVLLLLSTPVQASTLKYDMSIIQGCRTTDARVPLIHEEPASEDELLNTEATEEEDELFIENAQSVFLYDYENDVLVYTQNPDQLCYPASLVKIMTGLMVIERGNLDDDVTVRQEVLDTIPEESISINLLDGEVLKLSDLVYAIIVQSANEAAAVAADYISGSQDAFIEEMNNYAAELGCSNTKFTNVHGLHDVSQQTTARDIAKILAVAAKNETFMQAFGTTHYTMPATNLSEERNLASGNYLMNGDLMKVYLDGRVTGGRAGVVDSGERNLAITAEHDNMKLLSVVLGSKSTLTASGQTMTYGSFLETIQLLDLGFGGYSTVQLFYADQVFDQIDVINGDSDLSIGVKESVITVLPQDVTYDDLTIRYASGAIVAQAPVQKDDLISVIQVWHEDLCLAQTQVYALHDVGSEELVIIEEVYEEPKPDHTAFWIVAIIVVLVILLLVSRRLIVRLIRKHRIRQHRKNRRRSR